MQKIVTPEQMRQNDANMIEHLGIPGMVLMENAAMHVARTVISRLPENGSVLILCGCGNNGGDGLAVLRQLAMHAVPAEAVLLCSAEQLRGDARRNYEIARKCHLAIHELPDLNAIERLDLDSYALFVDALFGTGLTRDVTGSYASLIERINALTDQDATRIVVAVDIPSGIDGASGRICGVAMRANVTVTFQYQKVGHLLFPGRTYAGEVIVAPIGPMTDTEYCMELLEESDVKRLLPPRPLDTHKGNNGRALLMGGSEAYTGAVLLCSGAALRAGCGLLRVATPKRVKPAFVVRPEAMCTAVGLDGVWDEQACREAIHLIPGNDVLAIGPGMMPRNELVLLLQAAIASQLPLVIDADGLNVLAKHPDLLCALHKRVILTPHSAEMGRLLGWPTHRVLENPLQTATYAADRFQCTIILKGATSVIASNNRITINVTGNPGLAKGGSGDVLTGIVLALLAQGLTPYDAARVGAYLLGAAADRAIALLDNRMLLAGDVVHTLSDLLTKENG